MLNYIKNRYYLWKYKDDNRIVDIDGRAVEVRAIYADTSDYPKFTDSYILEAVYLDTEEELTDQELEDIPDDIVYDLVLYTVF